jgi:outer membrane protein assembly factor BamD
MGCAPKLEVKDFHAAKQYYHMRNYQAARVAFKNFNREWPNSKYREDAMYFILKSDYDLAMNSVESKKLERLNEAIKSYHNFADAFPQSVLLDRGRKTAQEHRGCTRSRDPNEHTMSNKNFERRQDHHHP